MDGLVPRSFFDVSVYPRFLLHQSSMKSWMLDDFAVERTVKRTSVRWLVCFANDRALQEKDYADWFVTRFSSRDLARTGSSQPRAVIRAV